MSRILVTGGRGLIGSNLVSKLVSNGNEVVVVDDGSTGSHKPAGALLVEHNIVNPLPYLGKFQHVYNLACPASPVAYQNIQEHTWKTSTIGIVNVVDYIKLYCPDSTLLHTSTSEIYGDPLEHPQTESYWGNVNPIGARSCYDEGKRAVESFLVLQKDLNVRIARLFNTYGPGLALNDGRVVSNFIVQALKGESLTIYGTGKQTRSFCYVDDTVSGLCLLMNSNLTTPVNIGNPQECNMLYLANLIIKHVDGKSKVIMSPMPMDDPSRRKPDISLAKEKLGWSPKVMLDEGLRRTIDWFKTRV